MRSTRIITRCCGLACGALFVSAVLADVDGTNLPAKYAGSLVSTQVNPTGFGDNQAFQIGPVTKGSEMDALYVTHDATDIWVGITGNLPNAGGDGQTIVLLIDAQSFDNCGFPPFCSIVPNEACCMPDMSCVEINPRDCIAMGGTRLGQDSICSGGVPDPVCNPPTPGTPNVLAVSNMLPGIGGGRDALVNLDGTVLEPGFYPDRAIVINRFGDQTYVDSFDLVNQIQDCLVPANLDCFDLSLTSVDPFNGHPISVYMDTTNTMGVDDDELKDGTGAGSQQELAATAVKGLRVRIDRLLLGAFEGQMQIQVILMAPDGTVSNQILPPLSPLDDPPAPCSLVRPGDQGACLATPPADFETLAESQVAIIDLGGPDLTPTNPTLIHEDIPGNFPVGSLIATQQIHTSFGDAVPGMINANQAGSELNQLFARAGDQFLNLAVSGNLENNGNKLYLFIDADPNIGESILDDNGDPANGFNPLATWSGRVFDPSFAPEHAYVVNNSGGTLFADHYDLLVPDPAGGQSFLGGSPVGGGSGILTGGANPNNNLFALDNSNVLGVLAVDNQIGGLGNPASATTGLEVSISLFELGILASPGDRLEACVDIKIWAVLSGTDGGGRSYLSNQALPPYDTVFSTMRFNVADDTAANPYDFGNPVEDMLQGGSDPAFAGDQLATVSLIRLGNVDLDLNCCVNTDDIDDFVAVLIGTETDPFKVSLADMNQDGGSNGVDIPLFIETVLNAGPCP